MMRFLRDPLTQSTAEQVRVKIMRAKVNGDSLCNKRFSTKYFCVATILCIVRMNAVAVSNDDIKAAAVVTIFINSRMAADRLLVQVCLLLAACVLFLLRWCWLCNRLKMCTENRKRFRHLYGRYTFDVIPIQ